MYARYTFMETPSPSPCTQEEAPEARALCSGARSPHAGLQTRTQEGSSREQRTSQPARAREEATPSPIPAAEGPAQQGGDNDREASATRGKRNQGNASPSAKRMRPGDDGKGPFREQRKQKEFRCGPDHNKRRKCKRSGRIYLSLSPGRPQRESGRG